MRKIRNFSEESKTLAENMIFALKLTHGKLHGFASFKQKHEYPTGKENSNYPK